MQSEYNNIDKLAQDAFAEFTVDTKQQQQHWKQMQAMLQPTVKPIAKSKRLRIVLWIAALLICGLFGTLIWQNTTTQKSTDTVAKQTINTTVNSFELLRDSNINIVNSDTEIVTPNKLVYYDYPTNNDFAQFVKPVPFTITFFPCDSSKKTDSTLSILPEEEKNKLALQQFFLELEKKSNVFEIDNNKDTLLICREGTTAFIKAHSFVNTNNKIQIIVKEFYSYADMIANKLTTISDDKQLISDGMVQISAVQNDKPVQLSGIKTITIKMPVTDYNENMQLFTGEIQHSNLSDILSASYINNNINWKPKGQFQRIDRPRHYIKVFDAHGQPYKTFNKSNGQFIAKFVIRKNLTLSRRKVLDGLKEYYGMFYDKIKLRRSLNNNPHYRLSKQEMPVVGDSVMMDWASAVALKLVTQEDIKNYEQKLLSDSVYNKSPLPYYEFQISKLGYINCDRFRNTSPEIQTEFYVNTGDSNKAEKIYTVIAVDKFKSLINSNFFSGSTTIFKGMPKDESVKAISIGAINGKVVYSIKPFITSNNLSIENTNFIETDAEKFKKIITKFYN